MRTWMSKWLLISMSIIGFGCAALRDDLRRAESHYEEARYEQALVWLEDLEPSVPDMDPPMRARYFFLRGMSALRLSDRANALYYLSLAREVEGEHGEGLQPQWRDVMERSLEQLAPEGTTRQATNATNVSVTD